MHNREIIGKRIAQFIDRLSRLYYREAAGLEAEVTTDREPIPYESLPSRSFRRIAPGEPWGRQWESAWFRFRGVVPPADDDLECVALIDVGSEACVFRGGTPWQGLTNKGMHDGTRHRKRRVAIEHAAAGGGFSAGDPVELLVEAAANEIMGVRAMPEAYRLLQADLVRFDRELWNITLDLEFLFNLAQSLPEDSVRSRRLIAGLNDYANVWSDGAGRQAVRDIVRELLAAPANASALTCWSVGHGHIDLGWLWPIRETRRKGGRTFATALRLTEEYPGYVFGASQPQLYEWIREDYPALYGEVQAAVAEGRWECQGAMWVEPDMNLPSGESLVRQCLYGKRFFREEFGVDVTNLWLPDVFGYSAALPQILRKCGVDIFMTQKISWNETNTFPHHTFLWEGIDGTAIRSHFLPTNTYNFTNEPELFVESEKRFAHAERFDDFLNLFGTGDGGGGPSRKHIEFALRADDTEGLPKVKLAPAEYFFDRVRALPEGELPAWRGELYLEKHRGTYTTQALMKKHNRRLEHLLHDVELLAVLCGRGQPDELERIWKDTLLNQFHDILPGSSIGWVYDDAREISERNIAALAGMRDELLGELFGATDIRKVEPTAEPLSIPDGGSSTDRASAERARAGGTGIVLFNPLAWDRDVVFEVDVDGDGELAVVDDAGAEVADGGTDAAGHSRSRTFRVRVTVPSAGFRRLRVCNATGNAGFTGRAVRSDEAAPTGDSSRLTDERVPASALDTLLENELLRVSLAGDGTISSIYRKDLGREYLAGVANRMTLWEDRPHSYDAWDINHYYRETEPESARLIERRVVCSGGARVSVRQRFEVGSSTIEQLVSLEAGSPVLRFDCEVDWREEHRHLRVGAETTIHSAHARYEIQYGAVERPTHFNTSWDEARFEVAAHRFADLAQPDAGFAMLNDCKYGHRIVDSTVELTLLRSPKSPDPNADLGRHAFAFAYFPHRGRDDAEQVTQLAHELNAPVLIGREGDPAGPDDGSTERRSLPSAASRSGAGSWFSVDGGSVKLETVKPAEDGRGVVLRLYEFAGTAPTVRVRLPATFTSAVETDLLEHDERPIELRDGTIELEFTPYEIRTFRLR